METRAGYPTQSAAALAVSGGKGVHISRGGVVVSLDHRTTFGRVEKLGRRWFVVHRTLEGAK